MTKSPCLLEMDDGLGEDPNSALKGLAGEEHEQPTLETPLLKKDPPRMNLKDKPGPVRYHIFKAVTEGDPEQLNSLSDYLQRTRSFLSDTEYTVSKIRSWVSQAMSRLSPSGEQ